MEAFLRAAEAWLGDAFTHDWVWRLAVSLVILVIGVWLAQWLSRILDRVMLRFAVESTLRNFLRNVVYVIAMVIVFIAALDYAGVPTTSLLAVLGAAGLAIGLALKDSLSNIASGVMLIMLRPFRAGDSVQIAGLEGVVDSVRIFQTSMHTADNREIILPNSQITTNPIINYTGRGERRIELALAMPFGEDLGSFRQSLLALAAAHPRIRTDPAPEVLAIALGETSISVQLRAWVAARDYGKVQSELLEAVLDDARKRGAGGSPSRREVHVYHHGAAPDAAAVALEQVLKTTL